MSANENDDPNREPRWDIPSDSSDEESQEETSEGGEMQVVARRPMTIVRRNFDVSPKLKTSN